MKKEPSKKRIKLWYLIVAGLIILLIGGYIYWVTTRALPSIKPQKALGNISSTAAAGTLPWPSYGQSAVGLNDLGPLATSGNQTPAPTASTAKIITALAVLDKKPLAVGQQGPTITLSPNDVNIYNKYVAKNGSVTPVVSGENITEYQMLEAMLLPSADNMADSLAIWAFGSLTNYSAYANQYLISHGLSSTHVGADASGFDPSTTSTAGDLVRLGEISTQNPVITGIVAMPNASPIPVVNSVHNINGLLGQYNVVGIKTGNTDQAGGVFLSSSKTIVNNQSVTVFTAIMGAPTLWQAMHSSIGLITATQANFASLPTLQAIHQGSIVGYYTVPWNKMRINAYASQSIGSVETWKGNTVKGLISLKPISFNTQVGQTVGTISTNDDLFKTQTTTTIVIKQTASKPSKWWLILHPSYVL